MFQSVNFLIDAGRILIIQGGEDELQGAPIQLAQIAVEYVFLKSLLKRS